MAIAVFYEGHEYYYTEKMSDLHNPYVTGYADRRWIFVEPDDLAVYESIGGIIAESMDDIFDYCDRHFPYMIELSIQDNWIEEWRKIESYYGVPDAVIECWKEEYRNILRKRRDR